MNVRPASDWADPSALGFFDGVAMPDYLADSSSVNDSLLGLVEYSPAVALASRTAPPSGDTAATSLGTAAHSAILEPMAFIAEYAVASPCEAVMASGARKGESCGSPGKVRVAGHWFCARSGHAPPDVEPDDIREISPEDYALVESWAARLRSDPEIRRVLDLPGGFELTARWEDPRTGVLCRARFDFIAPEAGIAVDLKTARDARESGFAKAIETFAYHRKVAHYMAAAEALGVTLDRFLLVALDKTPPGLVAAYELDEVALEAGRRRRDEALDRLVECEMLGDWPGLPAGIRTISLPTWSADRILVESETANLYE